MNEEKVQRKSGGLYKNVKVSVKTVNIVIIIGIIALFAAMAFLVKHNGFTVSFNTNGGSAVASQKVLYGETVSADETPVKEGYTFSGWYRDPYCTVKWDTENDTVTDSLTLYAGWQDRQ